MQIQLGDKVRDALSGFVGVASSYTDHLHNQRQYGIQPPARNSELKDAWSVDGSNVVLLKKKVAKRFPEEKIATQLGDEARDSITHFKGVVTAITTFINGCKMIQITEKALDKDRNITKHWFPSGRIENLVAAKKPVESKPKTGGPNERVIRF